MRRKRLVPEVIGIEIEFPIDLALVYAVNVLAFRHRRRLGSAQAVRDAENALECLKRDGEVLVPGHVIQAACPDLRADTEYFGDLERPTLLQTFD